ncbi:hypothetical protein [Escherichia coli]|nr:hypothetical protein [Escherichia coli]MDA4182196.1 hypothetical protein [Escherichia coli]
MQSLSDQLRRLSQG